MGLILIHSFHRRFIKLLKSQVVKGTPILLAQSDMDEYKNLVHSTTLKIDRHRGLYRLTLHTLSRTTEETRKAGVKCVIDTETISIFEKALAYAERRVLCQIIMGSLVWYCRKYKLLKQT